MNTSTLPTEKSKDELMSLLCHYELDLHEKSHMIETLQANVKQLEAHLASSKKEASFLSEALRLEKHRRYGKKSESNPQQEQLPLFDEPQTPDNKDEIEEADIDIQVPAHTRKAKKKTSGRQGLPEHLPRQQVIHDLEDADKICTCGCALSPMGEDITEQLDYIPAKMQVIVHIQKKYACNNTECDKSVTQAKKPAQPIAKSVATPGLLARIVTDKFQDHLPLYRQERRFQTMGIGLARNTLSLWMIRCAGLLHPLENIMVDDIIAYDVSYADESRLQVLNEKDRDNDSQSWMWFFSGGPPDKTACIYRYHPSRSHQVPLDFFEGYQGYLHCDGFSAYDTLAKANPKMTQVGCLYHARRKFIEAHQLTKQKKSGVAYQVLELMKKLAKLEKNIKTLLPDKIKAQRQEKATPILKKLEELLTEKQPLVPPKSTLGKAINYTLNQWPKIVVYLEDGRLENNNNRSERGIKPFATGRKNWYFAGSVEGAIASARLYSFVETCKINDIEPFYWFAYVFKHLPLCNTIEDYEALLPYTIDRQLLVPKNVQ